MRLTLLNLSSKMSKTFLFWFSNEHCTFRNSELDALFKLCKLDTGIFSRRVENGPFVLMEFPDDVGPKMLMNRSVLAHSCYEVWASGPSLDKLHEDFKRNVHLALPYSDKTFQIRVETFGKSIRHSEKLQLIQTFGYAPFKGKVDLVNPECSFHLLQYYGLHSCAPEEPYFNYFGRWITDGQRKLVASINLKTRKFIGNTSMDPLLSLIMANLAGVKEDDLVFDPFVGTGSLLVAAAVMGAHVVGSDIDFMMLHGRTRSSRAFKEHRDKDESVLANFVQYGVQSKYIDVLVGDASRPAWRDDFRFDAIITDPPYGIREPTERLGSTKTRDPEFKIKDEHLLGHIPSKVDYSLTDIYSDLMNYAAKHLRVGGRLAFWIPISREGYEEDKLPKNPCLCLVSNNEQVLTGAASRRLLVFQKTRESTVSDVTEMDGSALMYRLKFFETLDKNKNRRERKAENFAKYGRTAKCGQMLPS